LRFFLSNILLLFICLRAFGQVLNITNYETADYLGNNSFYDFAQSDDLTLFFGTAKGVIKYDGSSFEKLHITDQIDGSTIKHIDYLNNQLVFSTANELFFYDLIHDSLALIAKAKVRQLVVQSSTLYYLTNHKLNAFDLKTGSKKKLYSNSNVTFNTIDINTDNVIIGTNEGLFIGTTEGGDFKQTYEDIKVLAFQSNYDSSQVLLSDSEIWSNYGNSLKSLLVNNRADFKDFIVSDLGQLWIHDKNSGLIKFDGNNTTFINNKNGLKTFTINSLGLDKETNLWLLGNNGLSKVVINQPASVYRFENISKTFKSPDNLTLKTDTELISVNRDVKVMTASLSNLSNLNIKSAVLFKGEWLILAGNAIYKYRQNQFLVARQSVEYTDLFVYMDALYARNASGEFFELNGNSLNVKRPFTVQKITKVLQQNNSIYLIDSSKDVHIIDSLGILKSSVYKLPSTTDLEKLAVGKAGLLSFDNENIYYIEKNELKILVKLNKFMIAGNTQVFDVFEESNGNIWISTNQGILKLISENQDGASIFRQYVMYNTDDNFLSTYFETATELSSGELVFAHANGVTVFNPLLDNPSLVAPGIFIQEVYGYNYDRFNNISDTINIKTDTTKLGYNNLVRIEARTITHRNKRKASYQYKTPMTRDEWITHSTNDALILYDLPPGKNVLEFRGINNTGMKSTDITTITAHVTQPFWQKLWFYGASLGTILLIGFISYRSVNSYRDSRTKELQDQLNKELNEMERRSHLQILKAERLKQLNDLIFSQKGELEKKNKQIESQKYELSLTNEQIKKQKDLLEETSSKLKASINYAQRIQNALMSTEIEIKNAIDESFVFFQPRDVVSGDFFWFNKVKNDKGEELLILAAVDCTGHGVPGAIVSVVGMNLLNNITKQKKIYNPGDILDELNADIIENLRQNETQVNDGMDMSIVSLNTSTKELAFAGAKNPLMYIENGELIRIRGSKHAIGGQQRGGDRIYETHILPHTGKDRTYYIFSDGYQDQFGGEKGFKFLTSNFKELLMKINERPVLEQKEVLNDTINKWMGDYTQTDDILVIGFRF